MRIAYLDCFSGISGDMMLGALVDSGIELGVLNAAVASLGLPGCRLKAEATRKGGVRATQVRVETQPENAHRHLSQITQLIAGSTLTDRQKQLAIRIFRKLAEAEARVHGTSIDKVHFHEVGAADSIADIVGTAVGWDLLGIHRAAASPIPTGTGEIRIAHGTCRVPAPATAELLHGIPLAPSSIPCELTTPTGAAIVACLVDRFGPMPAMTIHRIGYGAGQRDLHEQPNVLRLFIGTAADPDPGQPVWVVETNLDDISGELISYCTSRLREAGALDVYTTAIQMKKDRPGVKLTVLCGQSDLEQVETILFEETTTLGVRRWPVSRRVLERVPHAVTTPWGSIDGKVGWVAEGVPRFAPEFEACRRLAAQHHVPLRAIYEAAQKAFDPNALAKPPQGP